MLTHQLRYQLRACGLTIDRHWDAARNILARGLLSVNNEGV
jgi:transposase